MANRRAIVTRADLARVLSAHRDAGLPVARTEVLPNGKIVVFTVNDANADAPNPWDERG